MNESMALRIKYDDATEVPYPNKYVEKLNESHSMGTCNEQLNVGDSVDCYCQDGAFKKGWFRGYVTDIGNGGVSCDVIYHDGYHESNIPAKDKIRLIKRCDTSGEWMVGKSALLVLAEGDPNRANNIVSLRSGTVESASEQQKFCRIALSDGSDDLISSDEVAKAVFRYLLKDCPNKKRYIWPMANESLSLAESVKLRRRTRNRQKVIQNYASPKLASKREKS